MKLTKSRITSYIPWNTPLSWFRTWCTVYPRVNYPGTADTASRDARTSPRGRRAGRPPSGRARTQAVCSAYTRRPSCRAASCTRCTSPASWWTPPARRSLTSPLSLFWCGPLLQDGNKRMVYRSHWKNAKRNFTGISVQINGWILKVVCHKYNSKHT